MRSLKYLTSLKRLEALDLSSTQVSDAGLKDLASLMTALLSTCVAQR